MGVYTRDYVRRPVEESESNSAEIPPWEAIADRLRVRLYGAARDAPARSLQEECALVHAATQLLDFCVRARGWDAADVQEGD